MESFKVEIVIDGKGLKTLFMYKIFTIPKYIHKNWNYKEITKNGLEMKFKLGIAPAVLKSFSQDHDIFPVLNELYEQESFFTIQNNKGLRYDETNQYIKCVIPEEVLRYFKQLFVSTIVYQAENMQIPDCEKIEFEFNTQDYTVNISNLSLFRPKENPYYKYAKNAASSLSVEAIGLEQFSIEKSKKLKNFYDFSKMSQWKEREKLYKDDAIADKAGIYMLYDCKKNNFYVGKAVKLQERMLQHEKNINGNDPIPEFTHYRYTVISYEYYEFLHLIENAAIHDIGWILNMPTAKRITPSLSKKLKVINSNTMIDDCTMVNNLEYQTKQQKK